MPIPSGFPAVARGCIVAGAALPLVFCHPTRAGSAALGRGDELYARGQLADARVAYAAALAAEPASFAALCRLARVESELGEDARGEEQRRMIGSAVEHARAA